MGCMIGMYYILCEVIHIDPTVPSGATVQSVPALVRDDASTLGSDQQVSAINSAGGDDGDSGECVCVCVSD